MRRTTIVVALLVALLTPIARAGDGGWHAWTAPTGGAFRQAAYVDGELVYTNTLHQGMGANSDKVHRDEYYGAIRPASEDIYNIATYDLFGVHRAAHNGDYVLPTDTTAYPDFTGEIAELRLAADDDELFVRWRFTSMPRPDAQIATLAFATEGASVDAVDWPRRANVRSPWQVALTAWGTGGALDAPDGSSTTVDVRAGDHVVEARVPLSALPPAPWSITGGAGLHDPLTEGQYWFVPPGMATPATPGNLGVSDAAVWSLLFALDQPWTFDERRQADMLWQGDATQARQRVDLAMLQSRASKPAGQRTGRMTRMFESRLDLGDGTDRGYVDFLDEDPGADPAVSAPGRDTARWFHYLGALQPYTLYVPTSYGAPRSDGRSGRAPRSDGRSGPAPRSDGRSGPAPRSDGRSGPATTEQSPLIVYLHGLNGLPDEPFGPVLGLEQEAEAGGYLLAGALGRGDNLYEHEGEVDVLEVIADISGRYRVDPDRIYLMGHSMGAQGTYAIALRNPDVFAAVAPAETLGSVELWRNGRNVPWFHIGAVADADADSQGAKDFYVDRSAEGWESTVLNYQNKTHEYTVVYDTLTRIFRWFDGHRRDPNPARVTYVLPPAEDPALGLVHDGAYWVSGMEGAPGASIDVETFGIPHAPIDAGASVRTVRDIDEGGRSGGDTLAELLETVPVYGPPAPVEDRVVVVANDLSAVTLDVARMGVPFARVDLDVDTDSPLVITLVDGNQSRTLQY